MYDTHSFARWTAEFEAKARARSRTGDPDWSIGSTLPPELVRSIQRFQVGESGDGANLIAKADAAGDPVYAAAVRLFVAEEQNHARLLRHLLNAAGHETISRHWTDVIFVRLRRALGLRLELMVLRLAFAATPTALRPLLRAVWWLLLFAALLVVLTDHAPALRRLGVTRTQFARTALALFAPVCATALPRPSGRSHPARELEKNCVTR